MVNAHAASPSFIGGASVVTAVNALEAITEHYPVGCFAWQRHLRPLWGHQAGIPQVTPEELRGLYQHCKEKHLHRYLAEYDFRYNHRVALGYGDRERAALAVKNAAGKRLTYRGTNEAPF